MDQRSETSINSAVIPADEPGGVYELLREDIIEGRLNANERLKVSALAERYGTSTNPVREALQQLRGEGFVVIEPNRGARVRAIDEAFLRDTYEIEVLVEPYLTRWFVGVATDTDLERLEAIQAEIEAYNFRDVNHNSSLDTQFHLVFYEHHYNRHAVEMWWKHREILNAISRRYPLSLRRRAEVLVDHRELIACLKAHDADGAAAVVARHVEGSGRHLIEQFRLGRDR
ncbi:MAG: GntR family transcriptional regulator [Devosia sp.]|nr:GntR family transcriptional regulator [Devosia sp.]